MSDANLKLERLCIYLERIRPSRVHCWRLGIFDYEEVCDAYQEYCIDRALGEPLTLAKLRSIARSYPGTLYRLRVRERTRLEDMGRIPRCDRYYGRNRKPLE